jgi:hypothetical protein
MLNIMKGPGRRSHGLPGYTYDLLRWRPPGETFERRDSGRGRRQDKQGLEEKMELLEEMGAVDPVITGDSAPPR